MKSTVMTSYKCYEIFAEYKYYLFCNNNAEHYWYKGIKDNKPKEMPLFLLDFIGTIKCSITIGAV